MFPWRLTCKQTCRPESSPPLPPVGLAVLGLCCPCRGVLQRFRSSPCFCSAGCDLPPGISKCGAGPLLTGCLASGDCVPEEEGHVHQPGPQAHRHLGPHGPAASPGQLRGACWAPAGSPAGECVSPALRACPSVCLQILGGGHGLHSRLGQSEGLSTGGLAGLDSAPFPLSFLSPFSSESRTFLLPHLSSLCSVTKQNSQLFSPPRPAPQLCALQTRERQSQAGKGRDHGPVTCPAVCACVCPDGATAIAP